MGRSRHLVMALVTAPLVLVAAGCTGGDPPAAGAGSADPTVVRPSAPVIIPGRPGEPARTISPGQPMTPVPVPSPNAADVGFVQDMIVHHGQALEMAALARSRAGGDDIRRLAARIAGAQGAEIAALRGWLTAHGRPQPAATHGGGHTGAGRPMPGMATPRQLADLGAARGAAFDRLFLRLMMTHHGGALEMAAEVIEKGADGAVERMAQEVIVTQRAEITRMADLLDP